MTIRKGYRYPTVTCLFCSRPVAYNWTSRHLRSSCARGARASTLALNLALAFSLPPSPPPNRTEPSPTPLEEVDHAQRKPDQD